MKLWCARCARYTAHLLWFGRKQFAGEWKCGVCGHVKKTPRGYTPLGGGREVPDA